MTINQIRVAVITKTTLSDLILALMILLIKSLCVQLRTSALNVTLPACVVCGAGSIETVECPSVCLSVDRQQQWQSAGLLLSALNAGSVTLRAEVRS